MNRWAEEDGRIRRRPQAALVLIAVLSVKGEPDEAWSVATGLVPQAFRSSVLSPLIA